MTIANPFPDQLAIANECIARQDIELRRLRLENGDLRDQVQAFDACKSDRAFLRQNVKGQAERIREMEGEVERLKSEQPCHYCGRTGGSCCMTARLDHELELARLARDPGQYDLPPTANEERD